VTDKGTVRPDVQNPAHRVPPKMVDGLVAGGIDVCTFAGNNNVDYGPEAMYDTIKRLDDKGIQVVGAGENLEAAQRPIYVDAKGVKIAFINACSILREGYAATETRPGLSPIHVSTFYECLENLYEQPGTPSRTVTVANWDDSARVANLI